MRVATPQASVLVVGQTYYPGWTAIVDGIEVPVVPVNVALVGVPLSAGAHDVQLIFRPLSFRIGIILTAVSTIVLGGMAVWPRVAKYGCGI
jgi:uncharacterized membrane protein YfhO